MAAAEGRPIIEIDMPSSGLVMGDIARTHPGVQIDSLLETSLAADGDLMLSSVAMARGLLPAQYKALHDALQARYGRVDALPSSPKDNVYIFRTHMALAKIQAPALRFLIRFQHEFKFPWSHLEGERCVLRGEVVDAALAEQLVPRVESFFRAGRLDARIAIVELSKKEVAARDLLLKLTRPTSVGS